MSPATEKDNLTITRTYQGRVTWGAFEDQSEDTKAVIQALKETHTLFQDAVNYHLVALAGMARKEKTGEGDITSVFRAQVEALWEQRESDLKSSLYRSFRLKKDMDFEEFVGRYIFSGCERPDMLPSVLEYILKETKKGDNAIQQGGRSLLPKLCWRGYTGTFEGDETREKRQLLYGTLRNADSIPQSKLKKLAENMDIVWAGVPTKSEAEHPGQVLYWDEKNTRKKVKEEMEALKKIVQSKTNRNWEKWAQEQGINLEEQIELALREDDIEKRDNIRLFAKCAKPKKNLKPAAVFFMYYPSQISAALLRVQMEALGVSSVDPTASLGDSVPLARGSRGYVYPGFTGISGMWEGDMDAGEMYEKEWDILAFKEALKVIHSFRLKTEERNKELEGLRSEVRYMEGETDTIQTSSGSEEDDEEESKDDKPVVLKGDPRYERLLQVLEEFRQREEDREYTLTERTLKHVEKLVAEWKERLSHWEGANNEEITRELMKVTRKNTASDDDSHEGSLPLYDALCRPENRCIWAEEAPIGKKRRAKNILRAYSAFQERKRKIEQLSRPVRVSAAHPEHSPRAFTYSDFKSCGPDRIRNYCFTKGKEAELQLAVTSKNEQEEWGACVVRVKYSAPRLVRDQLGTDSAHWPDPARGAAKNEVYPWLQPMMQALGLEQRASLKKTPAITLAFAVKNGKESALLNFPATLDVNPMVRQIGKHALWNRQFVGTKEKHMYLHWPSTWGNNQGIPWYQSTEVREKGFDVLSVDLGLRYAGAWNLTHVQCHADYEKLTGRCIGIAEGMSWYGFPKKQGLFRLDGEGNSNSREEHQSPRGVRSATKEEHEKARAFILSLDQNAPIDEKFCEEIDSEEMPTILELRNRLLWLFRRFLNRFRFIHACSVDLRDPAKADSSMKELCSKDGQQRLSYIPGLVDACQTGQAAPILDLLDQWLIRWRAHLPRKAEQLTNMILPRRRGAWVWTPSIQPGKIGSGIMSIALEPEGKNHSRQHIFHSGGLSIQRIVQIEKLRRVLQSMSKLLSVSPGQGYETVSGIEVQDPCPEILDKYDLMREDRVNKIAHLIVAQALGLRLSSPRAGKNPPGKDEIHGEYERIPGRKPVDFVVLENLSSYRTSVGKKKDENHKLMLWAHRQLVDKVKLLLEDVFGIPVLFAPASYTSRFDCMNSAAGFRIERLSEHILSRWKLKDDRDHSEKRIHSVYKKIYEELRKRKNGSKYSLYIPREGGEFFVGYGEKREELRVRHADMNAAVNIAWRALASPETVELLHSVRIEKNKIAKGTIRGKALSKICSLDTIEPASDGKGSEDFTAFYLHPKLIKLAPVCYLRGQEEEKFAMTRGYLLWKRNSEARQWLMCHQINLRILKKIGMNTSSLQELIDSNRDGISF